MAQGFFPILGEPLPVELANTLFDYRGQPHDALGSPAEVGLWLEAHSVELPQPLPRVTRARVEALRSLREAVRELLVAAAAHDPVPASAAQAINRIASWAPFYLQLEHTNPQAPSAEIQVSAASNWEMMMCAIAGQAVQLFGSERWTQIRQCAAPGCVLYFVQNRASREWCSPRCGNRVRVARYARRRRGAATH
jgi:predicted RNA-binding Zn ribbon-like protein